MKQTLLAFACACLAGTLVFAQASSQPPGAAPPQAGQSPAAPESGQSPRGEQTPPEKPTFRTGVELLTVDVTVLDRRGEPVTDLRAPEFTVTVDGKPRRVVSAEYVKIDVEAAKKAAAAPPIETHFTSNVGPPAGRLIVLVIDQNNVRMGAAHSILETASKFLDRLSPLDRVAFVTVPPPGPVVDFTTDHQRLRQEMKRVPGFGSKYEGQFNIGMVEALAITVRHDHVMLARVVQRECGGMGLTTEQLERCERDIEIQANEMVSEQRERTSRTLNAMRGLLRELVSLDGQKTLIFMSETLALEGLGGEIDDLVALAGLARVSINVLLLDVPRFDASHAFLSPTDYDDRQLEEEGLEMLAGQSRGALYRVAGTGEGIFDRLATELSGYYLLGVEQEPADRDGKRHRIGVDVRRRNVTLRSRRAFVLPENPGSPTNAEQNLANALKSPFAVSELPLRATTYAYQDPKGGKVRVVLAAEVGQNGAPPADYTLGFVVTDGENQVAAQGVERRRLTPADDRPDAPLLYLAIATLDPGSYTLRFGAIDDDGRRGTVLRPLHAWETTSQEFTVGDLVVGNVSLQPGERIMPAVEARVMSGTLGAYLELYAAEPGSFERTGVTLEVAEDESSAALASAQARLFDSSRPQLRIAQALVNTQMLPPGRYLARAQIARDGRPAGLLSRPFVILPRGAAASTDTAGVILPSAMVAAPPPFDLAPLLKPDVVRAMLDVAQEHAPALAPAVAMAREGKYAEAGLAAFEAGHQEGASFLRGLDLLMKGQTEKAASLLNLAAGPRRQFFPAAFYLGACFAAAGRDRDAAGVWQLALGTTPRPPIVYPLLADARLRDGHPEAVVQVLQSAYQRWPDDDGITKRLALAYAMSGKHGDAVPVLDAYLARHPTDQDALFAAVMSLYESVGGGVLSEPDRAKLARYASAYRGPQKALVAKYVETIRQQ